MFILKPLLNCLLVLLGLSAVAGAQSLVGLKIDNINYKGSGCPRDSVATSVAPDGSALSVLFSSFEFEVRPGLQDSRNCNLRFQITPPVGLKLKVMKIDYRGFAALSPGARARMNSQVLQQSSGVARTIGETNHDLFGPLNDVFLVAAASSEGAWSSCTGQPVTFNISSWLEVINHSNDVSTLSVDSGDMSLAPGTTFYLAWTKCSVQAQYPSEGPYRPRPRFRW